MFRKTNRTKNIRRKIETSDDEGQATEPTVVAQTKLSSKEKSKDKKKTKPTLGLSFDGEEEEGSDTAFQVKKSKASRRLATQRKLEVPADEMDVDVAASSYSAASLESLRANTPTMPAHLAHRDADEVNDTDDLLAAKFPSTMAARVGDTAIPDANAIHAAKKKRERLRQGIKVMDHDDFVRLDDADDRTGGRLIREEDDVGDDGEAELEQYMGEKMTLDKKQAKKLEEARRQDVRDMIQDAQSDDNDDSDMEQLERWEKNLIKHGGVRVSVTEDQIDPYKIPKDYYAAPVPEPNALPKMTDALRRLDTISNNLTMSIQQYEDQLADVQKRMQDVQLANQDVDRELQVNGRRFDYYQTLSETVTDLGTLFDDKMPALEELEKEVLELLMTKKEIVVRRRWLDDIDVLLSFCDVADRYLDQDALALEAADDEFDRQREPLFSSGNQTRRRTECQARLAAHRQLVATEDDKDAEQIDMDQGLWSDDEMGGHWQDRKEAKIESIQLDKLQDLLDDVSYDFRTLEAVMQPFEAWKTQYHEDYVKAFGSLSLPAAFEFHVRCELLSWDPMTTPTDLDTMAWHTELSRFGSGDGADDDDAMEGAQVDVEMINKVVEKVVLKRAKQLVRTLNPVSAREMRYASQLVEQLSYYVDPQDRAFQDLVIVVERTIEEPLMRYAQLIDAITRQASPLLPDQQASKTFFVARQMKILKNLPVWRRLIPTPALQSLGKMIVHRIIAPLLHPAQSPHDAHLQNTALHLLSKLD
ncbi:nineteen complex-related protein 2-domain-containing protein [Gongronella butleri]|nr:nineteen complex-related protein 2-domain-containing protein [Gongronella butleri]